MKLTRDKIQRMIGSAGYGSSAGSSGGGGGDIIGYATQTWVKSLRWWGATFDPQATDPDNVTGALTGVTNITASGNISAGGNLTVTGNITSSGTITGDTLAATTAMTLGGKAVATQEWTGQNYVSIAFFSRLFQAYNGSTAVNPNDLTTTIDNIKAMFGFWTDQYLTALGKNPNVQPSSLYLSQLADVSIPSPTDGQVLTYSSSVAKWIASNASSGTDMATVWANLAAADSSKQIDASHLTTAAATLFTSLVMSGNDLSMTVGGVTKSLTVGYATNSNSAGTLIGMTRNTTNNWSTTGLSMIMGMSDSWGGDCLFLTNQAGQMSFEVDGCFYQRRDSGGSFRCLDTADEPNLSVNYATSAGSAVNANYLTTYAANGTSDLVCLQNAYNSLPKSVGTAVRLQHGATSMAFGWFLDGYSINEGYGGWFVSDYDIPTWIGLSNGVWHQDEFITSYNIANQSVNKAALLDATYTDGASSWVWNPLNHTQYYVWGQKFYKSDISTDSGDIRLYIAQLNEADGLGLCMNIDGYVNSISGFYTQGGFSKYGSDNNYVLLGGGGHALISGLSVSYATSAGDAATLGGTAKSGLFTSLTSTWATNLSATIGGTTLSVSSLNADYAGQLRYTRSIWGQNFNGTADVSGDLYLNGSNLRLLDYNNSADCYIVGYRTGNSRAIGVAVEGSSLFEFNDEEFYSAVGIYAASYVTALSDIRYKDVIRHFALDAETIANASLIQFRWKDGTDKATHVGGIAQEWQAFLPEAVHETKDGKLSMDYGVIAYTAAVSLAKKVVAQQHEIDDLKQRLERLERLLTERKDTETQRKSL